MRRILLATSLLAGAAGTALLCGLPIDGSVRVFTIGCWVTWIAWNSVQRQTAEQQLLRIHLFAGGAAALQRRDGSWTPVRVDARSLVLANLAWLQFNHSSGFKHCELLRGNIRESKDWRRLQVIWRHCRNGGHSALGSSS